MNKFFLYMSVCFITALAGCGGGGGGGTDNQNSTSSAAPASSPVAGAGTTGPAAPANASTVAQSNVPNVQPIAVSAAPNQTRNMLTTSVTICTPGTTRCATIDNIQVDTGSQGLRILASALPAGMTLPAVSAGSLASGECAVFGNGFTWGAVRRADVQMAGELASSIPIEVIGDPTVPAVPSTCSAAGIFMQSTTTLRANGILGIGAFAEDCGGGCVSSPLPRWYYQCDTTGACTSSTQSLDQQVTNPVSAFASDNNGVLIDLPAVPDNGATAVTGSLIFGIGTQGNNGLEGATVLKADSTYGYVTTTSTGVTYPQSFFDSGSNGLFFSGPALNACGLWYCPTASQSVSATVNGTDGTSIALSFTVANATSLLATQNNAFNNLAGPSNGTFDWGLPFFFGRKIFTAIEARMTPAGNGPFYAF
jgi:Protein of unknown function (DUF3443)